MYSMLHDLFRVFLTLTRSKMPPCLGVGPQAECSGNDLDVKGNVRWSAYDIVTKYNRQENAHGLPSSARTDSTSRKAKHQSEVEA